MNKIDWDTKNLPSLLQRTAEGIMVENFHSNHLKYLICSTEFFLEVLDSKPEILNLDEINGYDHLKSKVTILKGFSYKNKNIILLTKINDVDQYNNLILINNKNVVIVTSFGSTLIFELNVDDKVYEFKFENTPLNLSTDLKKCLQNLTNILATLPFDDKINDNSLNVQSLNLTENKNELLNIRNTLLELVLNFDIKHSDNDVEKIKNKDSVYRHMLAVLDNKNYDNKNNDLDLLRKMSLFFIDKTYRNTPTIDPYFSGLYFSNILLENLILHLEQVTRLNLKISYIFIENGLEMINNDHGLDELIKNILDILYHERYQKYYIVNNDYIEILRKIKDELDPKQRVCLYEQLSSKTLLSLVQ